MTILLAYIPVLHAGYLKLFDEYFARLTTQPTTQSPVQTTQFHKSLYLISPELAQEFGPVHKDLHGLDTEIIKKFVESLQLFDQVGIVDTDTLSQLNTTGNTLHIPNEVISREFVKEYLPNCHITTSSIFLRWDKENAVAKHQPEAAQIFSEQFEKQFQELANEEGEKSSDWWRQVGAVAVQNLADGNRKIIAQAHNTHLPSEQTPYVEGDGRAQFHKGEEIDKTTAIHAEAKLIAEAAKAGISLAGADLYVTDFPCPTCAKLIAAAGFKRLFYEKGYAVFDGERVLKTVGVKLYKVT